MMKFYQRMRFVDEFDSSLFGGVLKMSMVVGEERSDTVYRKSMTCLMVMFELFRVATAVLIFYKMGFMSMGLRRIAQTLGLET